MAEVVSCVIFVPVDVIKERLQVARTTNAISGLRDAAQGINYLSSSSYGQYRGSAHALRTIVTEEGFRSLYRGYGATVLSYGPFSALYFLFYEKVIYAVPDSIVMLID